MQNPTITKFMNERVRPDAERVRAAYARGVDMGAALTSTIAPILIAGGHITVDAQTGALTAVTPDEIIDDERSAEGVEPLTVAEFVTVVNTMLGMTMAIAADRDFLGGVSKASVRPLEVTL